MYLVQLLKKKGKGKEDIEVEDDEGVGSEMDELVL